MKVIIAGSRGTIDYEQVLGVVADSGFLISEIVSGGAKGVDALAIDIAKAFLIPCTIFNADWDIYGRTAAGFIRNEKMAKYADALIAVWDGRSSGTKHMITIAKKCNLKVYVGY